MEKVRWKRSVGEGPTEKICQKGSVGASERVRRGFGEGLSESVRQREFVEEGPPRRV